VFEDDRVARDQGGDDRIHGREVWVVPGREHEHDAEWLAPNETRKTRLRPHIDVSERIGPDGSHMGRAFDHAVHLGRAVPDGAAHLTGELPRDVVTFGREALGESPSELAALRHGHAAPLGLSGPRPGCDSPELSRIHQLALQVQGAINRRKGAL
jgi:hypothetical protein